MPPNLLALKAATSIERSLGISDPRSSMTSGTQHRRLDESTEGNAPSAEDTIKRKGQKGGTAEGRKV